MFQIRQNTNFVIEVFTYEDLKYKQAILILSDQNDENLLPNHSLPFLPIFPSSLLFFLMPLSPSPLSPSFTLSFVLRTYFVSFSLHQERPLQETTTKIQSYTAKSQWIYIHETLPYLRLK